MKVKGRIMFSIDYCYWVLEGKKYEVFSESVDYATKSSARRAANRVAKKLGLEVEWEKEGK